MSTYDVVLAGLGGQGILMASKIMMEQAIQSGLPVRGAETHGMAQRGGSVVAHVRIGDCHGSEVLPRHAHLLWALDPFEGMRALRFLRPGGTLLVNTEDPARIDKGVRAYVTRLDAMIVAISATTIAQEVNNLRATNMALLGAACRLGESPFDLESISAAVRALIKPRFHASSLEALRLGAERCQDTGA
ncbi:MAG: indolepyruvate oxidoreductase subunit beta [Deltaproteobacteria bacterium]|nr:indolepyruvate oxidoreductase subunit beta [Deltaproteobacteria bacterium]